MPLLIAVILGLVLFFIKKDDSARKAENKKETEKEWNLRQDFRDEYTNRQFENQVLAFVENPEENRIYFKKLYQLSVDIKEKNIDNVDMSELSMGMTGDYEVAIEEGATMVRVGTGLFGSR